MGQQLYWNLRSSHSNLEVEFLPIEQKNLTQSCKGAKEQRKIKTLQLCPFEPLR
jgi:hypothetical protein